MDFSFKEKFLQVAGDCSILPYFRVKYRQGKLGLGGRSIPYEKMTCFGIVDGDYVPYIALPKDKNYKIVNMFHCLSIGVAEVLSDITISNAVGYNILETADLSIINALCGNTHLLEQIDVMKSIIRDMVLMQNYTVLDNRKRNTYDNTMDLLSASYFKKRDSLMLDTIKSIIEQKDGSCEIKRYNMSQDESIKVLYNDMIAMFQLKQKRYSPHIDTVKRLVNVLDYIYLTNAEMYCNILFDVMTVSYLFAPVYCCERDKLGYVISDENGVRVAKGLESGISVTMKDFGTTSYKAPNGDRVEITDGTGVGIYAYMILFGTLCRDLGEFKQADFNFFRDDIGTLEMAQKMFKSCLGNDFVGNYIRMKCGKYVPKDRLSLFNFSETNFEGKIEHKGAKYTCKEYEDYILFKRCYKMQPVAKKYFKRVCSMHYVTYNTLLGVLGERIISDATDTVLITKNEHQKLLDASKLNKELEERLRGRDDISCLKRENNSLKDTNKALKQVNTHLSDDIVSLKYSLSEKSNKIDNLQAELAIYKEKFGRLFDDSIEDEVAITEETGVSLEEMVSFLNDFKIAIVGGRNNLMGYLAEKGLKNIVQLNEEQCHTGSQTTIQCDFFCIQTKFIGHKIIRNVESKYPKQKGEMFYYNGTNADSLIRVCYHFITKWLEGEGIFA